MSDVKLLARWTGWCDPCETERPLALTETGQRGWRAWLLGVGHEDRSLTLTCGVCGEWQSVPHDEDDLPPEPPAPSLLTSVRPLGARQVLVRTAAIPPPYPSERLPAPRPSAPADTDHPDNSLDMVAEGFDLLGIAS